MQDKIFVTKSRLPDKEYFFRQLESVFQTAWVTNNGCHVKNLEKALCDYLNIDELLLCNNGTTALMLALQCAGLAGKKIALTPYSYVATLSALLWMGCTPVFVDVDPETMCLSPEQLILPGCSPYMFTAWPAMWNRLTASAAKTVSHLSMTRLRLSALVMPAKVCWTMVIIRFAVFMPQSFFTQPKGGVSFLIPLRHSRRCRGQGHLAMRVTLTTALESTQK